MTSLAGGFDSHAPSPADELGYEWGTASRTRQAPTGRASTSGVMRYTGSCQCPAPHRSSPSAAPPAAGTLLLGIVDLPSMTAATLPLGGQLSTVRPILGPSMSVFPVVPLEHDAPRGAPHETLPVSRLHSLPSASGSVTEVRRGLKRQTSCRLSRILRCSVGMPTLRTTSVTISRLRNRESPLCTRPVKNSARDP